MTIDGSWHIHPCGYLGVEPPYSVPLMWGRVEWRSALVCNREDLPAWMNCFGLSWKLTGIAKERLQP